MSLKSGEKTTSAVRNTTSVGTVHRDAFDRSLNTDDPFHYARVTGRETLENQLEEFAAALPVDDNGELPKAVVLYRNCPHCNGNDATVRFIKYRIPIVRCDGCGFVYANPILHPDSAYSSLLERGAMAGDHLALITQEYYRECARQRFVYELRQMLKYALREMKTYLEIGCSIGTGLAVARDLGLVPTGIEPAVEAAAYAREAGHEVIVDYFRTGIISGRKFDCVACMDVLEHVADPLLFMRDVFDILADDGIALFQVPNAGSLLSLVTGKDDQLFNGLIHLNYFTPVTLDRFAAKAGFRSLKTETVLSELGKLQKIQPEIITRTLAEAGRGIQPVFPLHQDWINDNGLGYKVIGIYTKSS